MKRSVSLLLSVVLILSLVCGVIPSVSAASALKTSSNAVNMIKVFEGFSKWPYLDNGQWTVGYGTSISGDDVDRYNGSGITETQATTLLSERLVSFESSVNSFIDRHNLKLTQNQFDALVCFTYNLGASWLNDSTGTLYKAVVNGATGNDFIFAMAQFGKAGGVVVGGLVERRLCEANLYLNGVYSSIPPVNYKYVTYTTNLEGAVPTVSIQGYDSTKSVAVKATTQKAGYSFLGWYTAAEGGEPVTTLGSKTASSSVLYAHWQNGDGERNADGTIKGVATQYSGYLPSGADMKIYSAPGAGSIATAKNDTKLTVTEEYVDSADVKWGKVTVDKKTGWVKLTKALVASPAYEDASSAIDPVTVTVTTSNVNNRVGPGTNYASQGKFTKGQQLTLTAIQKGGSYTWGKSEEGWIALKYTNYDAKNLSSSDDAKKVTAIGTVIKTNVLNVRNAPGVRNAKVGTYNMGDEVKITLTKKVGSTTWGLTEKGWVSLYYVKTTPVEAGSVPDIDVSIGDTDISVPDSSTGNLGGSGSTTVVASGKIINCNTLRIRAGAGTSYAKVGEYKKGTYVNFYEVVTANSNKWGRTDKGWISLRYVQLDAPTTGEGITGRVYNCKNLTVRAGAGTNYAKVTSIPNGTKVEILECTKVGMATWGRTYQGWISLVYVDLDEPISNLGNGSSSGSGSGTTPSDPETPATPGETTPPEPDAPKYSIRLADMVHGTVALSHNSAAAGTVVTMRVTPDAGYEVDRITVKDAKQIQHSVSDNKFTMPAYNVTITVTFKEAAQKYTVTTSATNGKVTASATSCKAGDKVTLTVTPDAEYVLKSLTAMNTTANEAVTVTNGQFTMPAGNVNVVAKFEATTDPVYTVTIISSANGTVLASTKNCLKDTEVFLTAMPDDGYSLVSFTVKDGSGTTITTDANNKFIMPGSNVSVSACFAKNTYSVTAETDSNGSISFNPGTYAAGATVTPVITPKDGYMLDTLTAKETATGAVIAVSNKQFVMPACNVTVKATFKAATYKITGVNSAYGTITTNPTSAEPGTEITITVKPATGYRLAAMTVKDARGNTITPVDNKFTMPASDVKITATFEQLYYDIAIPTAIEHGTVKCDFDKAAYNETISLSIKPETGYALKTLTVKDVTNNKTVTVDGYSFKMPAGNVQVTAVFDTIGYDVQVAKTTGGTVVPSMTNAHKGDTVRLQIAPKTDYQFEKYVVTDASGKEIKSSTSISDNSFTMPTSNVTVTATFKEISYNVTIETVTGGTVTSNKTTAAYGKPVALTATASTGYKLDKLVIKNDADGKEIKHTNGTFTMPRSSVTVTATFVQKDHAITLSDTNAEAKIGTTVVTKAHYGDTVAIVAKAGKTVNTVLVTDANGKSVYVDMTNITFTMPDSAVKVTITYK